MSRYNIHNEWRTYHGTAEVYVGEDDCDVVDVKVETFWIQDSMTAPYGDTYATDTWYEFDDSNDPIWTMEGKNSTYDEVVARIGEDEAQRILEAATR